MAPTYEEWISSRFRRDRTYADQIENILRDAKIDLPERRAWQLYMTPQMQNMREMAQMKAAEEGKANQRLLDEEVLEQQRQSEPGPAVDLGFVANAVNRMNGSASAMQQLVAGLQASHQAHVDGIAQQSRQETEKLAQEIRAEHERNRIAREFQSTLVDTLHADRLRMEEAIARAAASVNVPVPTADLSTTNAHLAEINAAVQRQEAGVKAATAQMMSDNREAFARLAAQQGLTSAEMAETLERHFANAQPSYVDNRSVAIDARSVAIDGRSVNVDARSVNVDARSATVNQMVDARSASVQQIVDNRSVANVVNVQGGPPPPPPAAGAVTAGTKRKEATFPYPFSKAGGAPPPKKTAAALTDALAESAAPPPPPPLPALPAPPLPRAKSAPRRDRPLAIEDRPARARTRSVRPTSEERAAMAEARAAARQAKEDEKARRYLDRELEKMNRQIARDALDYERSKKQQERGRRYAASRARAQRVDIGRPGRSPSRPKIDPEELAAAAEAALAKPKPKAAPKPKASVDEVTAMATKKFGKPKAKAGVKKTQTKDTIVRVPVAKARGRPRGRRMESAAAAVAAA